MLLNICDIALEYLRRFCAGDIEGLEPLLCSDLRFEGPLFNFQSSRDYLTSLRSDPPEICSYRILNVTNDADSVVVFYIYEKSEREITIAQLFRFRDQKIAEILLVFDGRGFS